MDKPEEKSNTENNHICSGRYEGDWRLLVSKIGLSSEDLVPIENEDELWTSTFSLYLCFVNKRYAYGLGSFVKCKFTLVTGEYRSIPRPQALQAPLRTSRKSKRDSMSAPKKAIAVRK